MSEKLTYFITFVLILLFTTSNSYSSKIKILYKIENEIITNYDIAIEKNYLIALNNNLQKLPKNQLESFVKESMIREKIKKIELEKFNIVLQDDKFLDQVIKDLYGSLNFQNLNDFEKYLSKYKINAKIVREKLKIETLWNKLIFQKYNKSLKIDNKNLKKKLENKIKKTKKLEEFNLSEILIRDDLEEKLKKQIKQINNDIEKLGFENAATIYSKSSTAKLGGKIGWVKSSQISDEIIKILKPLKIGNHTDPIKLNNSYIILKINNKKTTEKKIDFKKELEKLINIEKNKQLNQFSNIYFNKIKQNTFISEI
tara:strand:+ start:545 stop:1483 length:939 start_codon:yes stop_codon:yes gene_type:complete